MASSLVSKLFSPPDFRRTVFFFLFSPIAFSHVIQNDVSVTERVSYGFQEVCRTLVKHEAPLIDVVSGSVLDCMGTKIEVQDFCAKARVRDPYYLQGSISKEEGKVVCLSGKRVIFKYLCVKLSDRKLCEQSAALACDSLKPKLAHRLPLVSSSFTSNEKGIKQLNCYFSHAE